MGFHIEVSLGERLGLQRPVRASPILTSAPTFNPDLK